MFMWRYTCRCYPSGAGASKGSTVSFLVSTPQTGIDSIFLTYGMLGPVFALFRPLAAFVSGIFSGMVINSFDDDLHHHLPDADGVPNAKKSLIERLESGLRYGFLSLPSDIVVPLFQGLLIAAAIAIFIPPDFIAEYFSSSPYIMLFMMLAVSLPVYVCATASIPIAVVLMAKGVSAGAVFVFLMAGPATNASSIAVVKNILGTKNHVPLPASYFIYSDCIWFYPRFFCNHRTSYHVKFFACSCS